MIQRLDITREVCPMTFVRVKLKLEQLQPGERLEVLLKGEEPLANVPKSAAEEGHRVVSLTALGPDQPNTHLLTLEVRHAAESIA